MHDEQVNMLKIDTVEICSLLNVTNGFLSGENTRASRVTLKQQPKMTLMAADGAGVAELADDGTEPGVDSSLRFNTSTTATLESAAGAHKAVPNGMGDRAQLQERGSTSCTNNQETMF